MLCYVIEVLTKCSRAERSFGMFMAANTKLYTAASHVRGGLLLAVLPSFPVHISSLSPITIEASVAGCNMLHATSRPIFAFISRHQRQIHRSPIPYHVNVVFFLISPTSGRLSRPTITLLIVLITRLEKHH